MVEMWFWSPQLVDTPIVCTNCCLLEMYSVGPGGGSSSLCLQVVVDSEQIIALELSALMALRHCELPEAVRWYHDGVKLTVVCHPADYVSVITSVCHQLKERPADGPGSGPGPFLTLSKAKGEKVGIKVTGARNTYDKEKHQGNEVEGS